MFNNILLDLDGTLTDPKEGITKSVQYALQHFGIEEDIDNLLPFIGPPLINSFQDFYGMSEEDAVTAVAKYRERFSTIGIYENGVYPGIEDMLKALKESGKIVALATSKPHVFARRILEHYGLIQYFDILVGSEFDGTRNDKAEVIEEVCRQLNLPVGERESCIMVGDRKHDIIGAKKCNIKSVGVSFGYADENELELAGADFIVDTVDELKEFLIR